MHDPWPRSTHWTGVCCRFFWWPPKPARWEAALGDSQPTLSRRLAELEAALGQALFERSPRGLSPTAAGSALLGPARRMQQQTRKMALAMERHAGTLAGTVRVTASEMASQHLLLPALRPLREQHPEIQIELAPGDGVADLLRREAKGPAC